MQDAAPHLLAAVPKWAEAWGVPGLESRLSIRFSTRMSRSLGRCHPERKLIRLASWLREAPDALLAEVLCHEVAHVAVHELHGRDCRPHGREWKELMQVAGYPARTRIPEDQLPRIGRRVANAGRKQRGRRRKRSWLFR
jgi:predicted SprT family Zn-dependent metalloprotease